MIRATLHSFWIEKTLWPFYTKNLKNILTNLIYEWERGSICSFCSVFCFYFFLLARFGCPLSSFILFAGVINLRGNANIILYFCASQCLLHFAMNLYFYLFINCFFYFQGFSMVSYILYSWRNPSLPPPYPSQCLHFDVVIPSMYCWLYSTFSLK